MIGIGVIGYGYWGPNLVRNFSAVEGARVDAVSDLSPARLGVVKSLYPAVEVTTDVDELLARPSIDAVLIATPVATHYELALRALRAGKHVFIEKPLTETPEQAEHLIAEAEARGLVLHVDHTFIYTGAIRKIRDLIDSGEIGDLYYYDSVRVNLGLFQNDVDVMWDLAVHDLSIMDYLFDATVTQVSAVGVDHGTSGQASIAYLSVFFDNGCIAHLHVNWLSPVKLRRTLIGGSRRMVVYDDLEPSEKVKVYDKGIVVNEEDKYQSRVGYRSGDMWAPKLNMSEALTVEADAFLRSITHGERSLSDGHAGLRVVRILDAASRSLAEHGRPVRLDWDGKRMKAA